MSRQQCRVTISMKRRLAVMCAVSGLILLLGLEHAKAAVFLDWTFDKGDLSTNHFWDDSATMAYFDDATEAVTTFGNTASTSGVKNMPDGPGNFLHHDPFGEQQGGDPRTFFGKLYGQEKNLTTASVARMNLLLHGIEDFAIERGDTLRNPIFTDPSTGGLATFDCVLSMIYGIGRLPGGSRKASRLML